MGLGVWIRVDPEFEKYVSNSHTFATPLYIGAYMLIGVGVGKRFLVFITNVILFWGLNTIMILVVLL